MNRRCFLQRAQGATAVAAAASLGVPLSGCIGFHYARGTMQDGRLVLQASQFGGDRFLLVDAPGFQLPLYVFRHDDGTYSAVSTRCMHRGCEVEPNAGHLVCPCHGSEYANDGAVLKGPTREPLRRYPLLVEGGNLVIDLSAGEAS